MSQRAQESESQDLKTKRPLNHEPKQYEEQINYYNEYCRLYLANIVLATQLKELSIEKSELLARLLKLEKKAEEISDGNSGQLDEKKRRMRRSAVDIARHYKCKVEGCSKSYGSEGSLNQHIKIKHPETCQRANSSSKEPVKEEHDDGNEHSP